MTSFGLRRHLPALVSFVLLAALQAQASVPATCVGCDFENARLAGASFSNGNYVGTNFNGANLDAAHFDNTKLVGSTFEKANVSNATFINAKLIGVSFAEANLRGARFGDAVVCVVGRDGDSGGLQTSCIDLRNADVAGADFRGARICRKSDDCSTVDAATLRTYTHSPLDGALLP